jgi:mono/diheme cytochrome c family protein
VLLRLDCSHFREYLTAKLTIPDLQSYKTWNGAELMVGCVAEKSDERPWAYRCLRAVFVSIAQGSEPPMSVSQKISWLVPLVLVGLMGCERPAPIPAQFRASAEIQKLPGEMQGKVKDVLEQYCGTPAEPKLLGALESRPEQLKLGRDVYMQRCWQCHGETGDGAGPAAETLYPRPRDYRRGIFKFTSSPYGAKPRRSDLIRTVKLGVPGTSMPSFAILSEAELSAVVDYVLVLTHRGELEFQIALEAEGEEELDPDAVAGLASEIVTDWNTAESTAVNPETPKPEFTTEHVTRGKQAFLTKGCSKCHGEDGRGQTRDNLESKLVDVWGHPTRAADLTSGMLHGGREPIDIYRRIYAGINGTPMPEFKTALATEPETIWDLVSYVLYVSGRRRSLPEQIPDSGSLVAYPRRVTESASSGGGD